MQYKLLALSTIPSAAAASATITSLRGGPITQSSLITKYNHGLDLPPPDRKCLSVSTADICRSSLDTMDEMCNWCPDPRYDGSVNAGLCLSTVDVEKAMDVMAFNCEGYVRVEDRVNVEEEDIDEDEEIDESIVKNISVDAAAPDFSCFFQAWGGGDIDLCHNSKATDGTQCQWCTASDNLIEVGVCVTLAQIDGASKVGLSCPSIDDTSDENNQENQDKESDASIEAPSLQDGLPDINCFRAAWIADNAEDACNTSNANDGSKCVWCQTKGDTMGACVSGSEATIANGQFGLTCPSEIDVEEDEIDVEEDEIDVEDEEELEDGEVDSVDEEFEEELDEEEDLLDAV